MPSISTSGTSRATGRAAAAPPQPKLVILATYQVDPELITVRLIQVFRSRETRVLNTSFDDVTHARALLRAVNRMVNYSLSKNEALRLVVPDRTVAKLLLGDRIAQSGRLGSTLANIRRKVDVQRAQVTFEYGSLHSVLGEAAELVDYW